MTYLLDPLPGETARQRLMRSRRARNTPTREPPQPTPTAHPLEGDPDELTPYQQRRGHLHKNQWITPPTPGLVSLAYTGWQPHHTGQPAVWHQQGTQPRGAVLQAPCPFTHYIRIKTADTYSTLYVPPEELFIEKG